jgi:hypothetical protein
LNIAEAMALTVAKATEGWWRRLTGGDMSKEDAVP